MSAAVSAVLLLAAVGAILFLLRRGETRRRDTAGPAGHTEYRTDLAIDECMDRMNARTPEDEFDYTFARERDGSWLLHLTLHRPSQQPLDTLYLVRMDPGKRTVITLIFIREAFGYNEPAFPPELLDAFFEKKVAGERHSYAAQAPQ